jgi:hypothetical protein
VPRGKAKEKLEELKEMPKCDCVVKTPELYYHMPKCPYKVYMMQQAKEKGVSDD